ncbi:MAG: T9SS type A sorting domain-containing protein [Bacteroidales bacterium]|nr:T9SS type A sorting domain-containing protein [Bacteroidales bacterium]
MHSSSTLESDITDIDSFAQEKKPTDTAELIPGWLHFHDPAEFIMFIARQRKLILFFLILFIAKPAGGQNRCHNINVAPDIPCKETSVTAVNTAVRFDNAIQYRELNLNPVLQQTEGIRVGDTIFLALFENKHYHACIDKIDADVNGTIAIRARLMDYEFGYCFISTYGGKSLLEIEVPENNEFFMASYDHQAKKYFLQQIDKSKMESFREGPTLISPGDKQQNSMPQNEIQFNSFLHMVQQDILIPDPYIVGRIREDSLIESMFAEEKAKLASDSGNIARESDTNKYSVSGQIAGVKYGSDEDDDGFYEIYSFFIGINGTIETGTAKVYMKMICTSTGQSWWSPVALTITDSKTYYYCFPFDQVSFNIVLANTSLDFTVEMWDSLKTTLLASNAAVYREPIYADILLVFSVTFDLYGMIDNFTGGTDADNDGYYETYSFRIGLCGRQHWPFPSTVYWKIICNTTGQSWWLPDSDTITNTLSDYSYFAFDQTDFTGISGNTSLDFTVEMWNSSKTKLLASLADVWSEPVYADNQEIPGSPTIITVMIVYTHAAAEWCEVNETGIENKISFIMARSQTALDNSNTSVILQLVHSEQVNYTELNTIDDLYNLRNHNDGYMDNVHSLRNTYAADLVILLENINFVNGLGWLLDTITGDPEYAFSLTNVRRPNWKYTTIHEIGHNLGCHHHKEQNTEPGPGLFSYSAGWRWFGVDKIGYCSVMTYENREYFADDYYHNRVPHFSNPSIKYQGTATGDINDGDNARTIRETKSVVSRYRPLTLNVSPTTVSFEYNSSSAKRIRISSNTSWTVTKNATWLDLYPAKGSEHGTISVYTNNLNGSANTRIATITISGTGVSQQTVTVRQSPTPALTVSPDTVFIRPGKGGSGGFNVISNTSWTVSDNAAWLSTTAGGLGNGWVTVTAEDDNLSTLATRTAIVSVSADGVSSKTVTVIQEPTNFNVIPETICLKYDSGSSRSVRVWSNTNWKVDNFTTWLDVTPTNGTDDGWVTFTTNSANMSTDTSRYTTVRISGPQLTLTDVIVIQMPLPTMTVSPAILSIGYNSGSSDSLRIFSNTSWTVTCDADWLTVSPADGSNDSTIIVTADSANPSTDSSRSAIITVSGTDVSQQTITITQAPCPTLTVLPTTISLGYNSGCSDSFRIFSNTDWTVICDASWLTASPANGSNDSTIIMTADSANPSTDSCRYAIVTVTGTDVNSQTVTVYQEKTPAVLSAEPLSRTVSSDSGITTFTVISNINWIYSENYDWLSCAISNDTTLSVTYEENSNAENRQAEIFVSGQHADSVIIMLIQEGVIPNTIIDVFENTTITLYPNPASDKIYIMSDSDISHEILISLCDNSGHLLLSGSLNELRANEPVEIDMSPFDHGIYILRLNNTTSIKIGKIIKP